MRLEDYLGHIGVNIHSRTSVSVCEIVCYTAVFSLVTQRSSPLVRDDTKNGCVADYLRNSTKILVLGPNLCTRI